MMVAYSKTIDEYNDESDLLLKDRNYFKEQSNQLLERNRQLEESRWNEMMHETSGFTITAAKEIQILEKTLQRETKPQVFVQQYDKRETYSLAVNITSSFSIEKFFKSENEKLTFLYNQNRKLKECLVKQGE